MKKLTIIALAAAILLATPGVSRADLASGEVSGRQAATEINALIQRVQALEQQNAQLQLKVQVLEGRGVNLPQPATDAFLVNRVSALEARVSAVEARVLKVAEDLFWFASMLRRHFRLPF